MAIGGGGSGGGPVGSSNSFVGPQEALELVGNHAYAYTGLRAASTTAEEQIKFTTGNYYFVGRIYLNGAVTPGNTNGQGTTCELFYNGVAVSLMRVRTDSDDQPATTFNDIIIPSYTEVAASVDSVNNGAETSSIIMVGKIFRG